MATNGIVLIKPSSVAKTGASSTATINAGGSVTFGLCDTLSLNDVFSSAYDNYIIDIRHTGSNDTYVRMRFRLSGTDNSTANSYVVQKLEGSSTTVAGSRTTSTETYAAYPSNAQRGGDQIFLYGPALAQPTAGRSVNVSGYLSATITDFAWTHNQSTAYDGLTIYPGAGTFTGLIKVYGLVK